MASITGSKVGGDLRAGSARLVCRRTWAAALATLDQGSASRWCTASGSGLVKMRPSVLMSVCSRARVRDSGPGSGSLARCVRRFLGERFKLAQAHPDLRRERAHIDLRVLPDG